METICDLRINSSKMSNKLLIKFLGHSPRSYDEVVCYAIRLWRENNFPFFSSFSYYLFNTLLYSSDFISQSSFRLAFLVYAS